MPITAYIGFGSNLGELQKNLFLAKEKIGALVDVNSLRFSPLYYSEPLTHDGECQPWYLNAVFEITTILSPHALFDALKTIEHEMGRRSREKWAPRIVDLDLLFYGDMIYADDVLRIPHQEVTNRRFVLKPLNDLAPAFMHPEFGLTVREMLAVNRDPLEVREFKTVTETSVR